MSTSPLMERLESRTMLAADGLSKIVFDNDNFTGQHFTGIDAQVNSTWSYAGPATGYGADTFSVRWAGQVQAAGNGNHTFRLDRDGGVRLWVDDKLLIDSWNDQRNVVTAPAISLKSGQKYHIVLEYRDVTNAAWARLQWNRPGLAAGTFELVPQANLFSNQRDFPTTAPGVEDGYLNAADYGAVGDGINDDTAALQAAFLAARGAKAFLYVPNGTYRVTNTITLGASISTSKYTILQGQNRDNTVFKLDDAAPSFQDLAAPKPIITFLDGTTKTGQAFRNAVYDMTFDVGRDNAGATALRFVNNNQGGVRDVSLRAQPSTAAATLGQRLGARGLDLTVSWPGPMIVRNVLVDGFQTGIDVFDYQYSQVYEHVTIQNQLTQGIKNFQNVLTIRDLDSRNSVPAYVDTGAEAMLVMIDSFLTGGAVGNDAIFTRGEVVVRNTVVSGYGTVVDNNQTGMTDVTDPAVVLGEYSNAGKQWGFADHADTGLNLPIEETPDADYVTPSSWVRVDPSGADDTAAIRAAITAASAGSGVVYFPAGQTYTISSTINISGNIKRIIGMESALRVTGALKASPGVPVFKFTGLTSSGVIFERFRTEYPESGSTGWLWLQNDTPKTVTIKSIIFNYVDNENGTTYADTPNATGKVFIEDVMGAHWDFSGDHKVWARQLNPESDTRANVTVNGSTVWIMGLKTEYGQTNLDISNGATVELLGGMFYPASKTVPTTRPSIRIVDSVGSFSYRENGSNRYTIEVQETRGGTTVNYTTQPRGSSMPLYIARPAGSSSLMQSTVDIAHTRDLSMTWRAPSSDPGTEWLTREELERAIKGKS